MNTLPDTIMITAGTETAVYLKQEVCPSTEHVVIQPMAHYSQQDERWAEYEYDPGYTIGRSGCLITAIAMIGSFYYDGTITPLTVAQRLRKLGAFSHGLLVKPELISHSWPRLCFAGLTNWHSRKADMGSIDQELELFDATIVQVLAAANSSGHIVDNCHFIVLRQLLDNDAMIIDPWDGHQKQLLTSRYALPGWSVARAIYGIRRFRIIRDD